MHMCVYTHAHYIFTRTHTQVQAHTHISNSVEAPDLDLWSARTHILDHVTDTCMHTHTQHAHISNRVEARDLDVDLERTNASANLSHPVPIARTHAHESGLPVTLGVVQALLGVLAHRLHAHIDVLLCEHSGRVGFLALCAKRP